MEHPSTLSFAALNLFRDSLYVYMDGVLTDSYGEDWRNKLYHRSKQSGKSESLDLTELVKLFYNEQHAFDRKLPEFFPKQLISLIKASRNRVMHQHALSYRDAYRILDLMCWCLEELSCPDPALLAIRDKLFEHIHINIPSTASTLIPIIEESKVPTISSTDIDLTTENNLPNGNSSSIEIEEMNKFIENSEYLSECAICLNLAYKSEAYQCDQCMNSTCIECIESQVRSGDATCKLCRKLIPDEFLNKKLNP
jgi:hypothetical protein